MKRKVYKIILAVFLSVSISFGSFSWSAVPVTAGTVSTDSPSIHTMIDTIQKHMLELDHNPDYSSIWNAFDMMRSGLALSDTYKDTFYENNINYLEDQHWLITQSRFSDYSKLILAMTAMGHNAQNIQGHNLFYYLSDFSNVKKQGFNGPMWALMALKSHPSYQIPSNKDALEQTSEEGLIQYILERETSEGGWTMLGQSPDTDMTAMTIQSLASYYGKREDLTAAVDRALAWLSSVQKASGGYASMGVETSESTSQVIVALSSLGIDCSKDERFLKNGNSPLDALYSYYRSEGGFMHVLPGAGNNGGSAAGSIDGLATQQGMYALIAYERMLAGQTSLYDMSDVILKPEGSVDEIPYVPDSEEGGDSLSPADGGSLVVKAKKITLNYSQISLSKGKSRKLSASVFPANTSDKRVSWKSANTKIATVTKDGKVTGIRAGIATITVTSKDGSKRSASCKVIVTESSGDSTKGGKKVSGQTKTLGGSSKSISGGNSQNSNTDSGENSTDSGENVSKDQSQESSTQTVWDFSGEDYIPVSYEEDSQEDVEEEQVVQNQEEIMAESQSQQKTSTITEDDLLLAMLFLAALGSMVWWIRKRRKAHENE